MAAILHALDTIKDLNEAWEDSLDNRVRSIILKEQSIVGREPWRFLSGLKEKERQCSHLQCLCKEMNIRKFSPIDFTYGTLIDVYRNEPEEVTMGIVVQMFKKAGQFQKAEEKASSEVETDARVNVSLSSYTYNTLIDTKDKAGQLKETSETFAEMLRKGIAPTTLEEVALFMLRTEELRCPTDAKTYNIIISLHGKHNNDEGRSFTARPDLLSYCTLLHVFSIRHMITDAEDMVSEMDEKGLEVDETSECYSANIDPYGEHANILEAAKVFSCCQDQNKLTVLDFNVTIKAYGLVKNYDKACDLFDSIFSCGVVPDKCSFSSLIQILAKMQEAGLVSGCIQYCAVISSFVKLGRLKMAEELYKETIGFDGKAEVIVYGVWINAFADAGSVKKAITYVDAMKRAGLPGNTVLYNSLIKLYTKLVAAVGTLKEMVEDAIQPDDCAFKSLGIVLVKCGISKQAIGKLETTRRILTVVCRHG
ncbi:hypothetical protein P3X46_006224 [Hevea brasiliensis]|uniref:Pentacotripeptide-repeat region of PRORP domain-containing protein n=1 Tax=Hevea brasiliensis TaxID=3981 RepID=A0ABQ9MQ07_HEVBR|nr:hypothetical protein P3X46_006224 [Hevea brasiliensis]